MAVPPKKRTPRFTAVAQPRPQTLRVTPDLLRRRAGVSPSFTFALGARIGVDFTVIGHLSAGRISELYQVWSASYICALTCKILLPKFAPQSKEVRGLKREATLLRRLAHPNILHIFGQGAHEDRDFLMQEYLHGPSLFGLIDSPPNRQLPIADALKAIIHVCAALVHLHEHGYIHRDMKPANVILRGGIPVLFNSQQAIIRAVRCLLPLRRQEAHQPRALQRCDRKHQYQHLLGVQSGSQASERSPFIKRLGREDCDDCSTPA